MPKTAIIAVGDLHVNSTVALCPPSVNLDDGGTYRSSKKQRALWEAWLDFWGEMGRLDVDRRIVVLNGDLGELDTKRRSYQIVTPNKATILNMAIDTLLPALDVADGVIVLRGTLAHIGKSAWLEEAIANDIDNTIHDNGTASFWHFRGEFDGVRFDIAHHASMGRLPWTEKNAGNKVAAVIEARYHEMKAPLPHLALRSHNHRRSDSGRNYQTRAVCMPCWSSHTEFAHRIGQENSIAEIGGDVFICDDGAYKWIDYRYKPFPTGRRLWSIKI